MMFEAFLEPPQPSLATRAVRMFVVRGCVLGVVVGMHQDVTVPLTPRLDIVRDYRPWSTGGPRASTRTEFTVDVEPRRVLRQRTWQHPPDSPPPPLPPLPPLPRRPPRPLPPCHNAPQSVSMADSACHAWFSMHGSEATSGQSWFCTDEEAFELQARAEAHSNVLPCWVELYLER